MATTMSAVKIVLMVAARRPDRREADVPRCFPAPGSCLPGAEGRPECRRNNPVKKLIRSSCVWKAKSVLVSRSCGLAEDDLPSLTDGNRPGNAETLGCRRTPSQRLTEITAQSGAYRPGKPTVTSSRYLSYGLALPVSLSPRKPAAPIYKRSQSLAAKRLSPPPTTAPLAAGTPWEHNG